MRREILLTFICFFSALPLPHAIGHYYYDDYHKRCGQINKEDSGWHTFADEEYEACYMLVDSEMTWNDAGQYCKSLTGPDGHTGKGYLATFQPVYGSLSNIQQWLSDVSWNREGVWIGAERCIYSPTGFCWNGPYIQNAVMPETMKYNFWGGGQPVGSIFWVFDANCVQIRRGLGWRAATYPCNFFPWIYSFICAFPMTAKKTTTDPPPTTTTTPLTSTEPIPSTTTRFEAPSTATNRTLRVGGAVVRKVFFDDSNNVWQEDTTNAPTANPEVNPVADSLISSVLGLFAAMNPTTTASTTTTHAGGKDEKNELPGTSLLLIGIFVGFGITIITMLVFGYFFWKRKKVHPTTVVNVLPASGGCVATTEASKSAIPPGVGSLEIADSGVAINVLKQNAFNEAAASSTSRNNRIRKVSAMPPPYSSAI